MTLLPPAGPRFYSPRELAESIDAERPTLTWARIRSYHIVFGMSRAGYHMTLCGKLADGPISETFPYGEKTCESCTRLQLKREENR